jgi:hypothetical protein
MTDILDQPVGYLELPARICNALDQNNCKTVRDILGLSDRQLMEMPNFGRVSLRQLKQILGGFGVDKSLIPRPAPIDERLDRIEALLQAILLRLSSQGE